MDVIMAGPSQNALDHGCYHGWAMDALFTPPQHCFQAPVPVAKLWFLSRPQISYALVSDAPVSAVRWFLMCSVSCAAVSDAQCLMPIHGSFSCAVPDIRLCYH